MAGEDGKVNAKTADRLQEIVKGCELNDVWNADEIGLF